MNCLSESVAGTVKIPNIFAGNLSLTKSPEKEGEIGSFNGCIVRLNKKKGHTTRLKKVIDHIGSTLEAKGGGSLDRDCREFVCYLNGKALKHNNNFFHKIVPVRILRRIFSIVLPHFSDIKIVDESALLQKEFPFLQLLQNLSKGEKLGLTEDQFHEIISLLVNSSENLLDEEYKFIASWINAIPEYMKSNSYIGVLCKIIDEKTSGKPKPIVDFYKSLSPGKLDDARGALLKLSGNPYFAELLESLLYQYPDTEDKIDILKILAFECKVEGVGQNIVDRINRFSTALDKVAEALIEIAISSSNGVGGSARRCLFPHIGLLGNLDLLKSIILNDCFADNTKQEAMSRIIKLSDNSGIIETLKTIVAKASDGSIRFQALNTLVNLASKRDDIKLLREILETILPNVSIIKRDKERARNDTLKCIHAFLKTELPSADISTLISLGKSFSEFNSDLLSSKIELAGNYITPEVILGDSIFEAFLGRLNALGDLLDEEGLSCIEIFKEILLKGKLSEVVREKALKGLFDLLSSTESADVLKVGFDVLGELSSTKAIRKKVLNKIIDLLSHQNEYSILEHGLNVFMGTKKGQSDVLTRVNRWLLKQKEFDNLRNGLLVLQKVAGDNENFEELLSQANSLIDRWFSTQKDKDLLNKIAFDSAIPLVLPCKAIDRMGGLLLVSNKKSDVLPDGTSAFIQIASDVDLLDDVRKHAVNVVVDFIGQQTFDNVFQGGLDHFKTLIEPDGSESFKFHVLNQMLNLLKSDSVSVGVLDHGLSVLHGIACNTDLSEGVRKKAIDIFAELLGGQDEHDVLKKGLSLLQSISAMQQYVNDRICSLLSGRIVKDNKVIAVEVGLLYDIIEEGSISLDGSIGKGLFDLLKDQLINIDDNDHDCLRKAMIVYLKIKVLYPDPEYNQSPETFLRSLKKGLHEQEVEDVAKDGDLLEMRDSVLSYSLS